MSGHKNPCTSTTSTYFCLPSKPLSSLNSVRVVSQTILCGIYLRCSWNLKCTIVLSSSSSASLVLPSFLFEHNYYCWVVIVISYMFNISTYLRPFAPLSQVCWIGCPNWLGRIILCVPWILAPGKRCVLKLVMKWLWFGLPKSYGQ